MARPLESLVFFKFLAASLLLVVLHHSQYGSCTGGQQYLKGKVEEAHPAENEQLRQLIAQADATHPGVAPPWFHHHQRLASARASWPNYLVYVDEDGHTLKGFAEHATTSSKKGLKHFFQKSVYLGGLYDFGNYNGRDGIANICFEFVREVFAVGPDADAIRYHLAAELYTRVHQREEAAARKEVAPREEVAAAWEEEEEEEDPELPKVGGVAVLHALYNALYAFIYANFRTPFSWESEARR